MTEEEKKEMMARVAALVGEQHLRVTDLMLEYHKRPPVKPKLKDWEEWIDGLQEPMKGDFKKKGFEAAKTVLSFSRYYQEKNDYGMRDFMRDNLSKEDFEYYMKMEKKRLR